MKYFFIQDNIDFYELLWNLALRVSKDLGSSAYAYDIASPWYRKRMAADLDVALESIPGGSHSARILDLSCGKGLVAGAIRRKGNRAIGMDVSHEASDQLALPWRFWQTPYWLSVSQHSGKLINTQLGYKPESPFFSYYETKNIPVVPDSVDLVIAYAVYEHVSPEDRQEWLREIYQSLKPGGAVLIACCPRPESPTERVAKFFGIPCHQYLLPTSTLASDVQDAGLVVERLWLSHHVPCFLPGVPYRVSKVFWGLQEGVLANLDVFVGILTSSRWAHHSNLIARKL